MVTHRDHVWRDVERGASLGPQFEKRGRLSYDFSFACACGHVTGGKLVSGVERMNPDGKWRLVWRFPRRFSDDWKSQRTGEPGVLRPRHGSYDCESPEWEGTRSHNQSGHCRPTLRTTRPTEDKSSPSVFDDPPPTYDEHAGETIALNTSRTEASKPWDFQLSQALPAPSPTALSFAGELTAVNQDPNPTSLSSRQACCSKPLPDN
jgi:hypothetical protein